MSAGQEAVPEPGAAGHAGHLAGWSTAGAVLPRGTALLQEAPHTPNQTSFAPIPLCTGC